jgi:glycosyltransferase involved in cell wall biosynthesis
MNVEILEVGSLGHAAASPDDWVGALESLIEDPKRALVMGEKGREVAVNTFSIEALAGSLAAELLRVAGHGQNPVPNGSR